MDDVSSDWKASHRLSVQVTCPACAATGEMRVREDAAPPFTDEPRRTYAIDPARFTLLVGGETPQMACVACGARFPRLG